MKPYVPILSMTPAKITEPGVGASTWASGSHVWNGNTGTFMANDNAKAPSNKVCTGSGRCALYKSAKANELTPDDCCSEYTR